MVQGLNTPIMAWINGSFNYENFYDFIIQQTYNMAMRVPSNIGSLVVFIQIPGRYKTQRRPDVLKVSVYSWLLH